MQSYRIDPRITLIKSVQSGTHKFGNIFIGFEYLDVVRKIFGKNTSEVLEKLIVEVFPREGFMGVSDQDGHIIASQLYLNQGEEWSVYLDIVHELVHVRQFIQGKELFDRKYGYVDRPTEIEAYRIGTEEARHIGLTDKEIFHYLEVPWISEEEHIRLAKACDLRL